MKWWINELDPILDEFILASKKKIHQRFWREMFKEHEGKAYQPGVSDGWIVKFFPYNKDGKKNNLLAISNEYDLPSEVTKTNLEYVIVDNAGNTQHKTLELWAGFVGLKQDSVTQHLRPEIGWMIREADNTTDVIASNRTKELQSKAASNISLRVSRFPKELLALTKVKSLELHFTDSIDLPEAITEIEIQELSLWGKYAKDSLPSFQRKLKGKKWMINGKTYGQSSENKPLDSITAMRFDSNRFAIYQHNLGYEFHLPNDYRQTPVTPINDYTMSLPGCVQFTNGKFILQFPNGYYPPMTKSEVIQRLDRIRHSADKSYATVTLDPKELAASKAAAGSLFTWNTKLQPINGQYGLARVLLLNDSNRIVKAYFFFEEKDIAAVDKEIKRLLQLPFLRFADNYEKPVQKTLSSKDIQDVPTSNLTQLLNGNTHKE